MRSPAVLVAISALWGAFLIRESAGVLAQSESDQPIEAPRPKVTSQATVEAPPVVAPRPSARDDIQDLVYLASDRPVFLRLKIRVFGEGFRALRALYALRLLQSLDEDGDGVLNEAEMRNIPPSDQLLPPRGPQDPPREINIDPVDADADGLVTPQELTGYVRKSTGRPFAFKVAPRMLAGQADLFAVIDANGDGTLDGEELKSTTHAILKFDANDDEIIDQIELSIDFVLRPDAGQPAGEADGLRHPLIVVDHEARDAGEALFSQLVKRYDRPKATTAAAAGEQPTGDGRLDAGELGVSLRQFAAWDTNGDGLVDLEDDQRLLLRPVSDLEIAATFGVGAGVSVERLATSAADKGAIGVAVAPGDRGGLVLTIGGERFDLSIGGRLAPPADLRREYDLKFDSADGDKNEYLDAAEIGRLGNIPAAFLAVDRNGDKMVRKDELLEAVELEALLSGCRVVLSLSRDSESILDLVDEGADRQLGLRELRQAPDRILTWDRNGDGRIESGEIPANSRLNLETGETMLFRREPFRGRPRRVSESSASGPHWFRNMDRNRDGALSPREFLGPREIFNRLDRNADDLLSDNEALNAK